MNDRNEYGQDLKKGKSLPIKPLLLKKKKMMFLINAISGIQGIINNFVGIRVTQRSPIPLLVMREGHYLSYIKTTECTQCIYNSFSLPLSVCFFSPKGSNFMPCFSAYPDSHWPTPSCWLPQLIVGSKSTRSTTITAGPSSQAVAES